MRDFRITRYCDHIIQNEVLTIDGVTPNYFSILKYNTNGDKEKIIVREAYDTDGLSNFNPLLDGITDFELSSKKILTFNNLIGQPGVNYLDGITGYYPEKEYVASYISQQVDCPKCLGTGLLTDLSFNAVGALNLTSRTEYIKQKVVKALITSKGTNDLSPDYGSNLDESIGKPNLAFIMLNIQQSIFETINRIIEVQSSYIDSLNDEEIIVGIEDLVIMPSDDPRDLKISFNIISSTAEKVKVSFNLRT